MSEKKISVLLPNFNNGPFLREALDSLFNQTHQNFVIYFVDDCSTDNSIEVAESYQDPRLVIIKSERNAGIVATMNKGLAQIETEYFIRMDGDDISTPDRFEKLINFMENHPEVGVCSSDIRMFGKEDLLLSFERDPFVNKANLIFGHAIGHASSIFRTTVFKEHHIVYRDLFWRMEDYDLFYQLKEVTLTTSIPGEYYHYRRDTYNDNPEITARKNIEFRKFYTEVLKDLGLPVNDKSLRIHLELNNREIPSYRLRDYKNHIISIRKANNEVEIYPKRELEIVLEKYFSKFIYRLIGQKKVRFIEIFGLLWSSPQAVKYYFRSKIYVLFSRNKLDRDSNSTKIN